MRCLHDVVIPPKARSWGMRCLHDVVIPPKARNWGMRCLHDVVIPPKAGNHGRGSLDAIHVRRRKWLGGGLRPWLLTRRCTSI